MRKLFGDKLFWRQLVYLCLPIALQNLLLSSFTLVDTIMIGTLGETSLAAVGMAGQWSWLLNVVLFGFSSGASVFIAQYWGIKNTSGIHKAYGLMLSTTLLGTIVFFLVALLIPEKVLSLYTHDSSVVNEGVMYLRCVCFSYFAQGLSNVFTTVLRSTEKVKLPMYTSLIAVILNAAFNALFIFVLKMGVFGAALGTLLSAWVTPITLFIVSWKEKNMLIAPAREMFHWEGAFVRKYFLLSLPVLFNESLWALGTTTLNSLYGRLSTEFYASLTIFRSIENVAFVFCVGLCHACAVMIGKSVGRHDKEQTLLDSRRFVLVIFASSVIIGLAIILLRPVILLPFSVSDVSRAYAYSIMLVYGIEICIRNIPYITIVGIFRPAGDTTTGLKYDMLCLWGLCIPVTYLLGLKTGISLPLLYACMLFVEDIPKTVLCLLKFRSGSWYRPVTEAKPETGIIE